MPVVACPQCRRQYQVQGDPTGKAMKCPACQTVFRPGAAQPAAAAPTQTREQQKRMQAEQDAMDVAVPAGVPNQLFPNEPLPPNVDPLGNHVVTDPGFAEVDLEEIRRQRELEDRKGRLANAFEASSSLAKMQEEEETQKRKTKYNYLSGYNLFEFAGRIPRQTFWMSALLYGLVQTLLLIVFLVGYGMVLYALDIDVPKPGEPIGDALMVVLPIWGVTLVIGILNTWISFALYIKRYHDLGYSGYRVLLGLIPIVGPIWVLVECGFFPGTPGKNAYGPDPIKLIEQHKREMAREKAEKARA